MNQQQHFDDHIKDRLTGYEPPVPAGTWEKIAAKRGKKKPGALWFLFLNNRTTSLVAFFILLAGGSGAWLYIHNKNKEAAQENKIAATKGNTNGASQNINTVTTGSNNNFTAPAEDPAGSNSNPSTGNTTSNNITSGNTTTVNTTTGNAISGNATNGNTSTNNNPANRNTGSLNKQTTSSIIPFKNKKDSRSSSAKNNRIKDNEAFNNKDALSIAKTRRKATSKGKQRIKITGADAEGDEDESTIVSPESNTVANDGSLWRRLRSEAERATASGKGKQKPPIPLFIKDYLPGCPSIEKNASGNKKYFEIYAGPDYVFRSFTDTGNSAYLQRRKETTSYASAFSAGIRYTKVFNNSMSIRAGLNYSQLNEKFSMVQGNVVQVTYIVDIHGDTTGSFSTTGTRIKTTHNKYRSIDIPLTIGYELGNGRWHANINAGAMINIYSWQKGEVLDTAFNSVSITTGKNNSPYQFKTNTGIGFLGGVSVYYNLGNNMHLMAEPWFRYSLSPMNKDAGTFRQKNHTLGLRLGVRFDIP